MDESKRYKVIVSDRAKRMLGTHVRFLAQVNKEAATTKKKRSLSCNSFSIKDATQISVF